MATLTLEKFLLQPETKPATEYACGEAFQKPMPDGPHAAIQGFLMVVLYPFLARTKLGKALPELRCIFGPPGHERTYVPDLSVVAAAHLPVRRHLLAPPLVAIEVLSPDQHRPRFLDKIQFYLLYGVQLVWVFDPETRTVSVQTPSQEARVLGTGATLSGGDVLPGFSVRVDDIFAEMD
jgi:Uma2 family endonuclease